MDAYGDWVYTSDYGYIWRPHTTVVNVYNDWAPYRCGRWDWCPPYGWTWVADEPWGQCPARGPPERVNRRARAGLTAG